MTATTLPEVILIRLLAIATCLILQKRTYLTIGPGQNFCIYVFHTQSKKILGVNQRSLRMRGISAPSFIPVLHQCFVASHHQAVY